MDLFDEKEDEAVEERKEKKRIVPSTDGKQGQGDFIKQSLEQKTKLTDQEKDQFWNQFYQEFILFKQQAEQCDNSRFQIALIEKQKENEGKNKKDIKLTALTFLNRHICIIFLGVMSFNILWMQMLLQRFGNNHIVQLMKWLMIIITLGISLSLIRPHKRCKKEFTHE